MTWYFILACSALAPLNNITRSERGMLLLRWHATGKAMLHMERHGTVGGQCCRGFHATGCAILQWTPCYRRGHATGSALLQGTDNTAGAPGYIWAPCYYRGRTMLRASRATGGSVDWILQSIISIDLKRAESLGIYQFTIDILSKHSTARELLILHALSCSTFL